jgi:hypothetical protein
MNARLRLIAAGGWLANMLNQGPGRDHDSSIEPRAILLFMACPVVFLTMLAFVLVTAITDTMPNHQNRVLVVAVSAASVSALSAFVAAVWFGWRCGLVPFLSSEPALTTLPQPGLVPLTIRTRITGILADVEGPFGGRRRYRDRPAWLILGPTAAILMVRRWQVSLRSAKGQAESNAPPASVARLRPEDVSGVIGGTAYFATREKPAIRILSDPYPVVLTFRDVDTRDGALAGLMAWKAGRLELDLAALERQPEEYRV